tara:strand:- start:1020 stop:1802 length:783 start_codon:yes stop_codon:yes gene_type:complete
MESSDFHHDRAILDWQIELGATEAISDRPVNRYELPATLEKPKSTKLAAVAAGAAQDNTDPVAIAERAAAAAPDLDALRAALRAYDHCDLKKGARNLVFSDGIPGARVMLVGEAPGRDEDMAGKPFVGRAGQLLDKMLAAIDMGRSREDAPVYITNVLPWRPPQNRDPKPEEIAMMKPFLMRHIALAKPDVLVLIGNWSCQALLGKRGITRLRGTWTTAAGLPALPMFHPAYLLRSPEFKREAWADLLSLRAHLNKGSAT